MQTETMLQVNADNVDFNVIVALDALSLGHIIPELLIGMLATVALGSDRYSAKITKVTRKTITVQLSRDIEGKGITFRNTKLGWRFNKHYRLCIGYAEDYSPREEMGY